MSIVAIDIGLKRIGVAVSYDKKVVLPQKAIIRKNRNQAANEVSNLLKEKNAKVLVVGLPKGGKSEEEMQRRIEHFVNLLDFQNKIYYQDEYGSSSEAKELIKGEIKIKRDGRVDSLSATIILKRWLKLPI